MNKQNNDLVQIIKENHQFFMSLAHVTVAQIIVPDFIGISNLAKYHQYHINHSQNTKKID